LSAEVGTALAECDALIADAERRAGTALTALASGGLNLAEGAVWCDRGDKDVARLLRLAATSSTTSGESVRPMPPGRFDDVDPSPRPDRRRRSTTMPWR